MRTTIRSAGGTVNGSACTVLSNTALELDMQAVLDLAFRIANQ